MKTITYDRALQLTEKTFELIPYQTIVNLALVEECEEFGEEDIMYGLVYYTTDNLIQEWIEDNIYSLVKELNMVIIKTETLNYLIGMPSVGHDFIEAYWVPFWNKYYGEDDYENLKDIYLKNDLDKIIKDDAQYGDNFQDMKFLKEDGTLGGELVPIDFIDFKKQEIYVKKGLDFISYLLDRNINNYSVERGICLDNDWYIIERSN